MKAVTILYFSMFTKELRPEQYSVAKIATLLQTQN